MDKMKKYKHFCICCCKPLKNKYRLMKTVAEADNSGRGICDSYAAEHRWKKGSLCGMCYLTVLIVQKET